MTVKELKEILEDYDNKSEVLISLDQEAQDETGEEIMLPAGLNIYEDDELIYIGELNIIEEVDEDEE